MSGSNIVDIMLLRQRVNIGVEPDDNSGDPLRTAFDKINIDVDTLYNLLNRLGLDRLPEDTRVLTTADQIGSGNYALRNGNINEIFKALLFESIQGLVLGNGNTQIFSSNVDQFGFILNGLESTFILNHHNNEPSLAFLIGNLSNFSGNSLLLGLNYFDNNTSLWYPAFSIYKSGKVQVGSLTLLDDSGNIPYNRLSSITGSVPTDLNTLEKIVNKLQSIELGSGGSQSTVEVLSYSFTEPRIEWEITHNKPHKNYIFQVVDDNGNLMFPSSRKENGILRLIFTEAVTGDCIITFKN